MKYCHLEDDAWIVTCPICGRTRPSADGQPVDRPIYCNVNCYFLGHRFDRPAAKWGDISTPAT